MSSIQNRQALAVIKNADQIPFQGTLIATIQDRFASRIYCYSWSQQPLNTNTLITASGSKVKLITVKHRVFAINSRKICLYR